MALHQELVRLLERRLVLAGRAFLLLNQQAALLVTAHELLVVGGDGSDKLVGTLLLEHVQGSW